MKNSKNKTYIIELLLITVLAVCAFFISNYTRYILAFIVFVCALFVPFMLKKDNIAYTTAKKVDKILIIFAILYLALFYTLGIYSGYYDAIIKFSLKHLIQYILPITITIISTEVLRSKFLSLKTKTSYILVTIITVAIDVLLYINIYNLNKLNDILTVLGFLLFSSLSTNLFYNYISPKYGYKGILYYRLITTLYIYVIPITPDVFVYFRTFVRIIYPVLMYIHIDNNYNPDKELERPIEIRKRYAGIAFTFVILTLLIALISCKFIYGTLVIGSGSMSGELNKGDLVIFKSKSKINEGDIIVFKKEDIKVVHRVVKISSKKGKEIYYTKGDANPTIDQGYVDQDELVGKVLVKIKYIGKPTVWLREQFE